MSADYDDEFESLIQDWTMTPDQQPEHAPGPYGPPPPAPAQNVQASHTAYTTHPTKTGLTRRGKAALAIGVTVLAGGSLIGYQAHENNQVKAQEIALKAQALELQKLKEENRATQATEQTQTSQEKARQASIDKCVNRRDDKVGKSLGSPSYRDVIDACQAQYTGTASSADMQAAASTKATGGGVNQGVLIGGGVLAVFLVVAVKRGTRSNPA
ncbi:hypothetical protein [Streptomyces kaempferi]|uniref:Uncharacterized protein n=1 Tax=Streptomyces kaempferi TaxID=333725 RepID=A0ABW3XI63_9ACTN